MSDINSQPQRGHHIVPRFYLSGFAEPECPFLWVYRKGEKFDPPKTKRNPSPLSIRKKVSVERDFYADLLAPEAPNFDGFEKLLKTLEDPALPVFKKVAEKLPLTWQDVDLFSRYIAHLLRRGQGARQIVERTHAQRVWAMYARGEIHEALRENAKIEDSADMDRLALLAVEILLTRPEYMKRSHLDILDATFKTFNDQLREMTWMLCVAEKGSYFITSDNPTMITNNGLKEQDSSLFFPIDATTALIVVNHKHSLPEYVDWPRDKVDLMNSITAQHSFKEYYGRERSSSLASLWRR